MPYFQNLKTKNSIPVSNLVIKEADSLRDSFSGFLESIHLPSELELLKSRTVSKMIQIILFFIIKEKVSNTICNFVYFKVKEFSVKFYL